MIPQNIDRKVILAAIQNIDENGIPKTRLSRTYNLKYNGKTWRLATPSEMSGWATSSIGKGTSGLQLCDYYSGYSSAQCKSGTAKGAYGNSSNPYNVWNNDYVTSYSAFRYTLMNGNWTTLDNTTSVANSVRCVTSL